MTTVVKRVGAVGILLTMLGGLLTEARLEIKNSSERIVKLETREETSRALLKEIRTDIKQLLQRTANGPRIIPNR